MGSRFLILRVQVMSFWVYAQWHEHHESWKGSFYRNVILGHLIKILNFLKKPFKFLNSHLLKCMVQKYACMHAHHMHIHGWIYWAHSVISVYQCLRLVKIATITLTHICIVKVSD